MHHNVLPALSLLSLLWLTPTVHAAGPTAPVVVTSSATQIDLVVAELGKDGTLRATTLTLSLPDRSSGGPSMAELKTRVPGERGETNEYTAKVQPEDTAAGTRYFITLRRTGSDSRSVEMLVESARVLKVGTPVQIGKVLRPDGSGMTVTATVH